MVALNSAAVDIQHFLVHKQSKRSLEAALGPNNALFVVSVLFELH